MNIEVYEKPKIGKGKSYILQTSTIQAALAELAELNINVCLDYLNYNRKGEDYTLLECRFSLTSRPAISSGYIYIYVSVVRSEDKEGLEALLKEKAFPVLIVWIKKLLSYPPDYTIFLQQHLFKADYLQKELVIKKSIL